MVNFFPNNINCPRPIAPPITPNPPQNNPDRNVFSFLREGDVIFVQAPGGVEGQGVFLRERDGFLIWARTISGASYLAITSLDNISITKL